MSVLRLVQYWDTGAPPAEVAALVAGWAADPALAHRLFDRAAAMDLIAAHFPDRVQRAFAKCRYPAMQADFFRYCALLAEGGAYVDADTENGGGLAGLVEGSGRGCLMTRHGKIANDFLFAAAPGEPLFERVLARAVDNIEREVSNNVWLVTGPGIMTGFWQRPETRPLFDGFRILPVEVVRRIVRFRWDLEYKKGQEDWRDALDGPGKSIFQ